MRQILLVPKQGMSLSMTPKKRFISKDHLEFIREKRKIDRPANLGRKSQSEKIGGFGYALLAIPLTTFGLGCWQVKRKFWKEDLIKNLEEKTKMTPVPIPEK